MAISAVLFESNQNNILQDLTNPWILFHIIISILAYAVSTIAACAAVAAFLKEKSLKIKFQSSLIRALPSVTDCDKLQVMLLILSEIILGFGLLTGISVSITENDIIFPTKHKTLLSLLAFLFIAALLLIHYRSGFGGKHTARTILVAYLLLTLAYPGVKFVKDIILV